MENNKLTIDEQSLSCSTISFSTSKSSEHYRSITETQSSSFLMQKDSIAFVPNHIQNKAQQINGKSKSLSMVQISKSSANRSELAQLPLLQPLDIMFTSMDDEEEELSLSIITPPSLATKQSSFQYCNDLNSYLVPNADCHSVLNVLNNILAAYNDEIDFEVDTKQQQIEGIVFMSTYSVSFMLYVYAEDGNQTRFEFRRTSGDAMASAKFWAQIKGQYQQKMGLNLEQQPSMNTDDECFDFICLDLEALEDQNDTKSLSKSELDELTQSLVENDLFIVDELNYLYEAMTANHNICLDILANQDLMKQLINKSLLNKDICVSRIILLILEELAKIEGNKMTASDAFLLFDNINLLLNHQRELIKKYTIRLLSYLVNSDEWHIDNMSKQEMIQNLKKYESQCTNNLIQDMMQQIYHKLAN